MISKPTNNLEDLYIQSLELNLIVYLADFLKINNRSAMELYYKSKLCKQIHKNEFDIQYLDYKYLAHDLIDNETNIVENENINV